MLNKDIEGCDEPVKVNIHVAGSVPKDKIREARELAIKIKKFIASGGVIHKFKTIKWSNNK
jgi:aromatic ring-opening dioxygenase catalytic subunit (LigB family)